MKLLIFLGFLLVIITSILVYLIKNLKRQKEITRSFKYISRFECKEPHISLLLPIFYMFGVFFAVFVLTFISDGGKNFYFTIESMGISIVLGLTGIYILVKQIFIIISHFYIMISVDGDKIRLNNRLKKVFYLTKDDVINLQVGSRRSPSDCFVTIEFISDEKVKKLSMYTYWQESLLLKEWGRIYNK